MLFKGKESVVPAPKQNEPEPHSTQPPLELEGAVTLVKVILKQSPSLIFSDGVYVKEHCVLVGVVQILLLIPVI